MEQLDFPQLRQTYEWDCGAKSLQAVLTYYGIEVREELVIEYAGTNATDGTSIVGMLKTLKKFKLQYDAKSMSLKELREYIDKKIPVIVLLQAWGPENADYANDFHNGHWVVVVGYDATNVYFEDPYSFERTFLSNDDLEERWHSKEEDKVMENFGIAVFGKEKAYNSRKIIQMG
ncbi:MAG: peptidase C39 family protein [Candidatus Woesearchaeota archaeon]|nr:MAG: peptidase C39 family protein [Candidatus Woesearchaeota archaeon]